MQILFLYIFLFFLLHIDFYILWDAAIEKLYKLFSMELNPA